MEIVFTYFRTHTQVSEKKIIRHVEGCRGPVLAGSQGL